MDGFKNQLLLSKSVDNLSFLEICDKNCFYYTPNLEFLKLFTSKTKISRDVV